MKNILLILTLIVFIFLSCGEISDEHDWTKYDPNLKSKIDNLNCADLQKEFNTAEANSDMQRARTGTGNYKLMGYIDSKMQKKNVTKDINL